MMIIGLTGSIGMGKSTTLRLFADEGCATWDADAAVHRLYGPGGAAVGPVAALFPDAVSDQGVDRRLLAASLREDPGGYERLEAAVHPLVRADREAWLASVKSQGATVAVVDVPLLFETGGDREVDAVVVVSAAPEIQRRRVTARAGMTPEKFEQILSRQMSDIQKQVRADFVIETDHGLEAARVQVRDILKALSTDGWRSHRPGALHRDDEPGE